MATSAIAAQGAVLSRAGNPIAELTNISGPEPNLNLIKVTSHDSPDRYDEWIGGFKDGGEVTLEGNFIAGDTNGQIALINSDYENATVQSFTLTFPVAVTAEWAFTAVVSRFKTTFPYEDKVGFSATLKVTGKPVLTVTASTNPTAMTGIEENTGAALDFVPDFAAALRSYVVVPVNTASTWVKLTVTAAAAASITVTDQAGTAYNLTTGVQSGEIALGAADSLTTLTLKIADTGKVPIYIMIYVARA